MNPREVVEACQAVRRWFALSGIALATLSVIHTLSAPRISVEVNKADAAMAAHLTEQLKAMGHNVTLYPDWLFLQSAYG